MPEIETANLPDMETAQLPEKVSVTDVCAMKHRDGDRETA